MSVTIIALFILGEAMDISPSHHKYFNRFFDPPQAETISPQGSQFFKGSFPVLSFLMRTIGF
jgi:hypothetical protein